MEGDPLLPFSSSPVIKPSPLAPVPEHTEITVPLPCPSSSSSQALVAPLLLAPSAPSFNRKHSLHRSKTAPALATINDAAPRPERPQLSSQPVVRQAIVLRTMYLPLSVVIYWSQRDEFSADESKTKKQSRASVLIARTTGHLARLPHAAPCPWPAAALFLLCLAFMFPSPTLIRLSRDAVCVSDDPFDPVSRARFFGFDGLEPDFGPLGRPPIRSIGRSPAAAT